MAFQGSRLACLSVSLTALLACGSDPAAPGASGGAVAVGRGQFCDGACVVATFKELAFIYRPSGEEKQLRDRLVQLAEQAKGSRWQGRSGKPEILPPDRAGNFLIRVPATGRFSSRNLPPVALQAHMDMVLAATTVPAGGDLKAFFRNNPISLEVKEGKLQSVGQTTTIGADNTVGCALMLRYVLDPTVEHPPLELVFTVQEEVGLRGALEYDTGALPLRAPVMIGLDGFDSDRLLYGSQGSMRRSVSGPLPAQGVSGGKLLRVRVSKLLGGHSGADIHHDRLNAVIALAAITKSVLSDAALGVVSAVAGDLGVLNRIPTDLELVLSVPEAFDVAVFRASTEATVRAIVSAHMGEAGNSQVTTTIEEMPPPAEPVTALLPDAASRLVETVLATEISSPPMNGVVSRKAGLPNEVNTSSNLGALEMKLAAPASPRKATVGFMSRSFSTEELDSTTARLIDHLKGPFGDASAVTVNEIAGYKPWLEDPDSWLIRLGVELEVQGNRPFRSAGVSAVGLEPSAFLMKFPDLKIVGMGAAIADAHSARETVAIQSILDITATVDAFLVRLAEAEPFVKATPRPIP
jgi:dipeptidase D